MSEELVPTYDPETLRESYPDPDAVRQRIAELRRDIGSAPDDVAELMARGELVDLLRASGVLDDALAQARLAVDRAELVGSAPQQHTARLRLAHVYQWRGEFVESDLLFIELLAAAAGFGPVIEAFTHQHAGQNDYDQRRYDDAAEHFAAALELRRRHELPDEQIASSERALAAARRHGAP
jgi:tetratricopeptide (TPR) repeat protein